MAIYRGTGGFSNVTGVSEIEYVTQKAAEIQDALDSVNATAAEVVTNTSAAESAANTAISASVGVQGYATIASTKAGEAQVSATSASTSATTATTKASEASASATSASDSASTASTQAGIATTQATTATTQAANASTSATTATTQAGIATTKAAEALANAIRAEDAVTVLNNGTINDTTTTLTDTWSSSKISSELSDKAPTTNPSFTGSITEDVYELTGTELNPSNGTVQYKILDADVTFTDALTSGQSMLLRIAGGDTYAVTFPSAKFSGGVAPTLTADDSLVIWKEQTQLYIAYVGTLVQA